jgi:fimbrial isopeptide formation D2 family protein
MAVTRKNRFTAIRRSLVLAAVTAFALLLAMPAPAYASGTGKLTVNAADGSSTEFVAYQIFAGDVADSTDGTKTVANIAWATEAAASAVPAAIQSVNPSVRAESVTDANDAAEWIRNNVQSGSASAQGSVPNAIAFALMQTATNGETLEAGVSKPLSAGYWIVASRDSSVGQDQSGTSAILVVVGGSDVTVAAKSGVPTVEKQALEDSDDVWQKQADATAGDDLYWRLDATVPSILSSYTSYKIVFDDTLGAGLAEPSDIHVYLAPAAEDVWETGLEVSEGWAELDDGEYTPTYTPAADGGSFKVALDLMEAVEAHAIDASQGVRIVVVYNAPLSASLGTGLENGSVNTVTLIYPKSTYSTETTTTQESKAVAYSWNLILTKLDADDGTPLSGAVLRIRDDRGRYLAPDGTWSSDEATVTTGSDGMVCAKGVDAGTFTVEEVSAPAGYQAFAGTRTITLAVPYEPDQIVSGPATRNSAEAELSAESPLKASGFDSASGIATVSVPNAHEETSILGRLGLPDMSDLNPSGLALGLVVLGAAILIAAGVLRRRGGDRH